MKEKNTVEVGIKTTGFEEAAEQIELVADAIDQLPATLNIKAKDCKINVHSSNYIAMEAPEPLWAKGGVRLEPDLDLEWTPEEEEVVLPKETIKEMCMMDFLKETKKTCEERTDCQGCFLEDENGDCKIRNSFPEDWKI